MNRIRKFWKRDNFFFHFKFGSDYFHLNQDTCNKYDKVVVQDNGNTAKDTLVEIVWIERALVSCEDKLLITSVNEALQYVFSVTQHLVQFSQKKV